MRTLTITLVAALAAGCATHSEVVSLGSGRYMVGYEEKGKMDSWAEIKAFAIKDANNFCLVKGQDVDVIEIKTHGVRGWSPQGADVTFRCVAKPST